MNFQMKRKIFLDVIKFESLDFLIDNITEIEKLIPDITSYNSIFCTLGSRVKNGKEEFRKIEYTYVLQIFELCVKYKIPHFSYCSSENANKQSYFLLWKTKGETEEELQKKVQ